MSKEQSYQNVASELLRLVGGKENVISAAHCATRLRLVLKDESKADVDGILKIELVKGQFSTGGQFQIIIFFFSFLIYSARICSAMSRIQYNFICQCPSSQNAFLNTICSILLFGTFSSVLTEAERF